MVDIVQSHFGVLGADIVQVIAFVAMFSCLLANVTVAARTSYSLARDNMLPFSKLLSTVGKRTKTPIYSLIFVGLVAVGVNFLSSGIATQVLGMIAVVLYITYGSTLVAGLIGAVTDRIPAAPARYFDLGKWLKPLCIIGIGWSAIVIACMTVPEGSHLVAIYTFGFEIAALVWYLAVLRRRLNSGIAGPRLLRAGAVSESKIGD